MAPIRTAIIGLSSTAITSWASTAHLPYLLSPLGRQKFQIVALCNTSVEAAQRAISTYSLPPDTKAYGDPQALADDANIDLVVCCTRVDVHYSTILPSVKAGKGVFVEWPLAQDAARARELVGATSEAGGGRTLVGLQGRVAPVYVKIRKLLDEGRIGKVLSSEARAAGGSLDREFLPPGLRYFTDRSVGGNIITIGFAHMFDSLQNVLGELNTPTAHLQLQRPVATIRDPSTNQILETTSSNVPDLILATGTLPASKIVQEGATLHVRFRRGQPFRGEPAFVWTVNGEKGEIRLVSPGGPSLQAGSYTPPVTIEVHDFESDEVEVVDWSWESWQEELPIMARNIAALYERFAAGVVDDATSTFASALERHEQIGSLLSTWK